MSNGLTTEEMNRIFTLGDDNKIFNELAKHVTCDNEVMALGKMMREWLQNAIVDSGTHVDQGAGLGQFDLWATVGGKNMFITIKFANKP